jgi:two-component system, chemotaxis family, chemotaxis protein CheY
MTRMDPSFSVLIIDPNEVATPVLKRMLGELGIVQIDSVTNGVDALAKLQESRPTLVMTEWDMQPMRGDELLRAMRADPMLAETPVMVVTAEATPAQFFEAMDAGVKAYAVAPFPIHVLAAKLEALNIDR